MSYKYWCFFYKMLYIYLISHNNPNIKTHTYIGCTESFLKRLNQHNGLETGGPRVTKRAAGSWVPVLILKYDREKHTISSKEIKREWKQSSRGLQSRVQRGIQLAVKYKLPIVMPKTEDSNIDIIKFINERWKDDKAILTDEDWEHILSSDF